MWDGHSVISSLHNTYHFKFIAILCPSNLLGSRLRFLTMSAINRKSNPHPALINFSVAIASSNMQLA